MRRIRQLVIVMLLLVLLGFGVTEWFAEESAQTLDPVGQNGEYPHDVTPGEDPSDPDDLSPEEEHLAACTLEDDKSKITSATFWVDVDVSEQKVRIMEDGDIVHREFMASTGVEGKETPLGTFEIQNRGDWFYNDKYKQGARYWVSFRDWGIYLFHTVAMDKYMNIIPEEAEKLGTPASHGCIRLEVENAKWIYDFIPERTKVVIHE